MDKRIILFIFTILWGVALSISSVWAAPPPLPSSFYGTLTAVSHTPAFSTDTTITAYIGKTAVSHTTLRRHEGQWVYTLKVPGDDLATTTIEGGKPGDTITFYINGRPTDHTAVWQSGTYTQLDLTMAAPILAAQTSATPWILNALLLIFLSVGGILWRHRQNKKARTHV